MFLKVLGFNLNNGCLKLRAPALWQIAQLQLSSLKFQLQLQLGAVQTAP
jgi:hypothetical protein